MSDKSLVAKWITEQHNLAQWTLEQWDRQVSMRPKVNVYRRTLDNVWRQVYKHVTGEELPREQVTDNNPHTKDLISEMEWFVATDGVYRDYNDMLRIRCATVQSWIKQLKG